MNVEERTSELAAVHEKYINVKKPGKSDNKTVKNVREEPVFVNDGDILNIASNAKNGSLFSGLMNGSWKGRYTSRSEADLALCNLLAFYTGRDALTMDRLFRQSDLMREKWDEIHGEGGTYGQITISRAIVDCGEVYTPPAKKQDKKLPPEEPPDIDTGFDALVKDADTGLPRIIVTDRDMGELSDEVLKSLEKSNVPPVIFVRAGALVRIDKSKDKDEKVRPVIKSLSETALRGWMARTARYFKVSKFTYLAVSPPIDITKDIMAIPEESWPFPYLTGLTQIPILRKDGTLFDVPGYDADNCLYHLPEKNLKIDLDIKTENAIELLYEIYYDFPFDCEASKTNCIALLFTLILREMINGPVPMAIIDKPQQGTGASLLADVNSCIASGANAYMEIFPSGRDKENELRKRITSILIEGRSYIVLDNIENTFQSAVLGALLTCTSWQDRALGENRLVSLPHRTVWIATGNNVMPAGDMPRRCYAIKLDAKQPRPWTRTGFKHPNLLEWAKENRSRILSAIFKLAQNWIYAGRPIPADLPVLGNFEEWTQTMGGILRHAGINGFLGNLDEMYEKSENDEGWEAFLEAWHEELGEKSYTLKEVNLILLEKTNFARALPENIDINNKNFTRQFGQAIKKKEGMVYPNKLKIERNGVNHHAIIWKVTCMNIGELGSKGNYLPVPPAQRENIQENIYTYIRENDDADNDFPWEQAQKK
jgi:hypothetical protein